MPLSAGRLTARPGVIPGRQRIQRGAAKLFKTPRARASIPRPTPFHGGATRCNVEAIWPSRRAEFQEHTAEKNFVRNGWSIGPRSRVIAAKSWTPPLPSLNRTRNRKPPSISTDVTLVSIEAPHPLRLLARTCAAPVLAQLPLPRQCPFPDQIRRHLR